MNFTKCENYHQLSRDCVMAHRMIMAQIGNCKQPIRIQFIKITANYECVNFDAIAARHRHGLLSGNSQ